MKDESFVAVSSRFCLRGWAGMPYALVDCVTALAHPIPKPVFDTLRLCNGEFKLSDPVFFGSRHRYLDLLEREGVLVFSADSHPLGSKQAYRRYPNHHIRQVQWSLTGKCNYRCRHCFMSAPHGMLPQTSTEECLRIVDQMKDAGILTVKITGGEPLIRRDFLTIVDRLCEHGIAIATILTNGALVTEELLDALEERGVRCGFDISFDGTDGWHDWLRGVDGAEKAAVRAFKLCRECGFPTGAQFMLHRGNVGVLRKSMRLLGELGVGLVGVGTIRDDGEAHAIRDMILGQEELFDAFAAYLPQYLEDGAPLRHINLGNIFIVENGVVRLVRRTGQGACIENEPACAALRSSLFLSSDGYILPCIQMGNDEDVKRSFPNVADMTLAQALTESSYLDCASLTVGDVLEHNPECQACAYCSHCLGGCRAKGVDGDGMRSLLGIDRDKCRFYLGGYHERAVQIVNKLQPSHVT